MDFLCFYFPFFYIHWLMFYLWNDVFKDFIEDAGTLFRDADGSTLSFNKFYTINEDGETQVAEEKVEQFLDNVKRLNSDESTEAV